jgi:hypothetical protein
MSDSTMSDSTVSTNGKHNRCRIEPYLIKAARHGAPLARRQRRAQPWEARPATTHQGFGGYEDDGEDQDSLCASS